MHICVRLIFRFNSIKMVHSTLAMQFESIVPMCNLCWPNGFYCNILYLRHSVDIMLIKCLRFEYIVLLHSAYNPAKFIVDFERISAQFIPYGQIH